MNECEWILKYVNQDRLIGLVYVIGLLECHKRSRRNMVRDVGSLVGDDEIVGIVVVVA